MSSADATPDNQAPQPSDTMLDRVVTAMGPRVRIHLPPPESLRTIGPAAADTMVAGNVEIVASTLCDTRWGSDGHVHSSRTTGSRQPISSKHSSPYRDRNSMFVQQPDNATEGRGPPVAATPDPASGHR
jgi:hypothetical protein